ncbi:cobalt ECF transporter T component CbiQ [Janibacter indicus]|uniref:cobalt ECF transporter T component CbiQ n=1 Tax=unclassified Janibacter TaxID=2649294 RepID=UPI0020CB7CD9|nr:cobalt ECF transporter T component CbiQ [Janibacter sp. CX7]UTT65178.1 cobalt ECF transporter T component CbiQ [Janibacter sp. CX7]
MSLHSPTRLHAFPAHLKIVAAMLYVIAVVLTPREAVWALGLQALLLLGVVLVSRVPLRHLAPRLLVEVPFVLFAVLMPFVATGPRVDVGPLSLSEAGLWGGWNLLVKGTLGVGASLVLAATTTPSDVVAGLARLRLPAQLVLILGFMVRYTEVISGQLQAMRVARESRGFSGRGLRAWPALASTAGSLFVRSYERGERVHLAMLARGFDGRTHVERTPVAGSTWAVAMLLPVGATIVLAAARLGA